MVWQTGTDVSEETAAPIF